jgi:prepilin-type N-terminal cleavage/methylation domain-containing protein
MMNRSVLGRTGEHRLRPVGANSQCGLTLIEVVISIAVLGILLVGFVPALLQTTRTTINVDDRETAKNLAESQLEFIKDQPYQATYSPYDSSSVYPAFTIDNPITGDATISNRDSDIQSLTVVVRKAGVQVISLTGYKTR